MQAPARGAFVLSVVSIVECCVFVIRIIKATCVEKGYL